MKHFYVGSTTEFTLRGHRYERLGDVADFTEEQATGILEGGGLFVTEAQFAKGNFTKEELRRYALPGPRAKAPAEFLQRLDAVQQIAVDRCNALRELRQLLHDELAQEASQPPQAEPATPAVEAIPATPIENEEDLNNDAN